MNTEGRGRHLPIATDDRAFGGRFMRRIPMDWDYAEKRMSRPKRERRARA